MSWAFSQGLCLPLKTNADQLLFAAHVMCLCFQAKMLNVAHLLTARRLGGLKDLIVALLGGTGHVLQFICSMVLVSPF